MDELATRGMELARVAPLRKPNLFNAVLMIYDKNGVLINDMRTYMTERINGENLLDYMDK